jgi:hypothetical protein
MSMTKKEIEALLSEVKSLASKAELKNKRNSNGKK